jgi:xylulokinase
MYLIGYDIGSSSIKAALVDARTGETVGVAQHPDTEMAIAAPEPGWAEQDPESWWNHVCSATRKLLRQTEADPLAVRAVGIAYQMHGLVLIDDKKQVLRPSIIWCDSRAVDIGREAFRHIGREKALEHLLNSPGNFTASKLRWVKENEPGVYKKIHKMMLPGDYIAMRLTGEVNTTIGGLSEGVLWDFKENDIARLVLEQYGIESDLLPEWRPTFSEQGQLTEAAAEATGLPAGVPVSYRAGDQPNNALALNVLKPGEVAATGGTSGVVYAVTDQPLYDPRSRVNGFAHVNYTQAEPRIGVLMCINGAGIQYSWLKHQAMPPNISYEAMERLAGGVPIGAEGLSVLPFGNGAERILENRELGSQWYGLDFNRHTRGHLIRAGLEGVAFAFAYGIEILQEMGLRLDVMRVGNDNLFQSRLFAETVATLAGSRIEMLETTGAVGAARGAGVGAGIYDSLADAFRNTKLVDTYQPHPDIAPYRAAYEQWRLHLDNQLALR